MAAQVLDEQQSDEDDYTRSLVTLMLQGCEQMEEMVDGMLALCRVDQEEIRIERVDLAGMTNEILLNLRALDPSREVTLKLPESFEVSSDNRLLRILLQNLLSNAWKYSRDGVPLEISMTLENIGNEIQLSVRDNGIGFSMESAEDLFSPFKRLHPERNLPGTGIGLTTARRVVHRLGGRIWVTSRPGQGSEFFFTLPARNVISGT